MSLEWQHLRPWHGTQHTAFEELCCILAAAELPPNALRFVRKGAPDAGVEGYWILNNDDEWGYQTKFFLMPPGSTQWGELDDSVKVALEKHPRLVRYTVCLPLDRGDPRLEDTKHMKDRWDERVKKWQEWAQGRNVQFEYWGTHELARLLTHEKHRGRHLFWFDRNRFSDEWFANHLSDARAQAGERYTAPLNVELPISQLFDGLARTPHFWHRWRQRMLAIRDVVGRRSYLVFPTEIEADYRELRTKLGAVIAAANGLEETPAAPLDLTALTAALQSADLGLSNLYQKLHEIEGAQRRAAEAATKQTLRRYSDDNLNDCLRRLQEISDVLETAIEFANGPQVRLATGKNLLVTGEAGSGKTHLLCDAADQRAKSRWPTVVLFGEQFNGDDPWTSIVRLLGQTGSREDLLPALEAAGEARRCRILLLIDAINEGEGLKIWPSHLAAFLTTLGRYPHLALALSVRTTYRNLVIDPPLLVPERLLEVTHTGFADRSYAAVRRFFGYYGLKQPSWPLLTPEFTNPLFLKLFCSAVKNEGLQEVPPGVSGITGVFDFFLRSINAKLARPTQLNYDPTEPLVQTAVAQLSAAMATANATHVSVATAREICEKLLHGREFERSLFRRLQTEGVITRHVTSRWEHLESGPPTEIVRFTYQRFSDHLLVTNRLAQIARPAATAEVRQVAADFLQSTYRLGLLEALAIQLPESFGVELLDVAPSAAKNRAARQAFIASIAWRKTEAVTEETRACINRHLPAGRHEHYQLLDVFLMVSAHPRHLLNADFLHRHLLKFKMADRDAWWSVYLHKTFEEESAVARVIDWAWEDDDRSHLSDDAVRLAATTLLWFCTTSHRFVRDRATKALVSLLETRIPTLLKLIPDFWTVDDPYVTERLMAVAYGCAMRTTNLPELTLLAQTVYDTVFRGEPPTRLLLRDHARGVIAVAQHRGCPLDGDPRRTIPPFHSPWITSPPPLDQLEKKYKAGTTQASWSLNSIFSSMTHGDFGVKIINGYFEWSGLRRNSGRRSMQQIHDEFVAGLKPDVRLDFDYFVAEFEKARSWRLHESLRLAMGMPPEEPVSTLIAAESELLSGLSKTQARIFQEKIKPFLEHPGASKQAESFDLDLMRRWMLRRIFQLGWTIKRFGEFDANVRDVRGREAHKPERIGKKYQWIAYDEFLARCSDNLAFDNTLTRDFPEEATNGMWVVRYRDIDPSLLLSAMPAPPEEELAPQVWWVPQQFDRWTSKPAPLDWLKNTDDLMPTAGLLRMKNPEGRTMLNLEGFSKWLQPEPIGKMAIQPPDRREVWMRWRSYLIRKENLADMMAWSRTYNFINHEVPGSRHWYHSHLGEHYWQAGFQAERTDLWAKPSGYAHRSWPHPVVDTCAEYMCEDATFDCSIADTVRLSIPCQYLFETMELRISGRGADCRDESGGLVIFDPSAATAGPSCLIADEERLLRFLDQAGLALFWGVCGEKNFYPENDHGFSDRWLGRLCFNGGYSLVDGKITGEFHSEYTAPLSRH